MGEQASAGWYPDGRGNHRYWDGSAWTEQIRPSAGSAASGLAASSAPNGGTFAKLGSALKKAAADKQEARAQLVRRQVASAGAAGNLVTGGVFGTSTIEIYDRGFVRVASWETIATSTRPIEASTPYERLRSIRFTPSEEAVSPRASSALEGVVGTAVAGLMKGGAGLLKATVPGLAVAGLAHVVGAEARISHLTIATDAKIHTLTNQSTNGIVSKSHRAHEAVGRDLEAAGNSVLDALRVQTQPPGRAPELQSAVVNHVAVAPDLGDRLRELAGLNKEGVITDAEFATAKARLLGGI